MVQYTKIQNKRLQVYSNRGQKFIPECLYEVTFSSHRTILDMSKLILCCKLLVKLVKLFFTSSFKGNKKAKIIIYCSKSKNFDELQKLLNMLDSNSVFLFFDDVAIARPRSNPLKFIFSSTFWNLFLREKKKANIIGTIGFLIILVHFIEYYSLSHCLEAEFKEAQLIISFFSNTIRSRALQSFSARKKVKSVLYMWGSNIGKNEYRSNCFDVLLAKNKHDFEICQTHNWNCKLVGDLSLSSNFPHFNLGSLDIRGKKVIIIDTCISSTMTPRRFSKIHKKLFEFAIFFELKVEIKLHPSMKIADFRKYVDISNKFVTIFKHVSFSPHEYVCAINIESTMGLMLASQGLPVVNFIDEEPISTNSIFKNVYDWQDNLTTPSNNLIYDANYTKKNLNILNITVANIDAFLEEFI